MILENYKLYIVTRSDLKPGQQLSQATHAAIDFILEYPELSKQWREVSNHICILSVNNEEELNKLIIRAETYKVRFKVFKEPDYDFALTAIAFEPGIPSLKVCSGIKLALK